LESTLEEIISSFYHSLYFWTTDVHSLSFSFPDFLAHFSLSNYVFSLYTLNVLRGALHSYSIRLDSYLSYIYINNTKTYYVKSYTIDGVTVQITGITAVRTSKSSKNPAGAADSVLLHLAQTTLLLPNHIPRLSWIMQFRSLNLLMFYSLFIPCRPFSASLLHETLLSFFDKYMKLSFLTPHK